MPGTAKVLGLNLERTCYFLNWKYSVSIQIVVQLFVCLSVIGLILESFFNAYFPQRAFFNL